MNKLFDTHAHYDDRAYGDNPYEFINRILSDDDARVAGFMQIGCSVKDIPKSLMIAEKFDNVYAAVGFHPHYAGKLPNDYISRLRKWAEHPKVRAIGETGLDYHYEGYCRDAQIEAFRKQLDLSRELNLPAVIHSRDAAQDTMNVLREYKGIKAVMHCYSGSVETARELIQLKVLISFTGVITFKNAKKAVEVCREVPLSLLMLETDCPYMAPEPFRGKLCDSSMAWQTAAKIAEIKGISTEEVVEACNNNAKTFFNIEF